MSRDVLTNIELNLDHVGLGIRSLDSAKLAFERMGFTLSSRSIHAGSLTPGGPIVPWGSGNHCAMFRHGYFELLGLVDEALPSNLKRMVANYEGLHIVALSCDSAEEAHKELKAAEVAAAAPATLERDAAFGPSDKEVRRARFRNVYLDTERYPEARFIIIEHRSPEVLWQQHLLTHPNGAESLHSIYFVVSDVQNTLQRFRPMFGVPRSHGEAHCFTPGRGKLWVLPESAMHALSPISKGHAMHRVAAACIGVKSLSHLKSYFDRAQVAYMTGPSLDAGEAVWVGPAEACHSTLIFIQTA